MIRSSRKPQSVIRYAADPISQSRQDANRQVAGYVIEVVIENRSHPRSRSARPFGDLGVRDPLSHTISFRRLSSACWGCHSFASAAGSQWRQPVLRACCKRANSISRGGVRWVLLDESVKGQTPPRPSRAVPTRPHSPPAGRLALLSAPRSDPFAFRSPDVRRSSNYKTAGIFKHNAPQNRDKEGC